MRHMVLRVRPCSVVVVPEDHSVSNLEGVLVVRRPIDRIINEQHVDSALQKTWPHLRGMGSTTMRLFGPRWETRCRPEVWALMFALQHAEHVCGWWEEPRIRAGDRIVTVDEDAMDTLDLQAISDAWLLPRCRTAQGRKVLREMLMHPVHDPRDIVERQGLLSECLHCPQAVSNALKSLSSVGDTDLDKIAAQILRLSHADMQPVETLHRGLCDCAAALAALRRDGDAKLARDVADQIQSAFLDVFVRCGAGNLIGVDGDDVCEYNRLTLVLKSQARLFGMRSSLSSVTANISDDGVSEMGVYVWCSKRKWLTARGFTLELLRTRVHIRSPDIDAARERMQELRPNINSVAEGMFRRAVDEVLSPRLLDLRRVLRAAGLADVHASHAAMCADTKWVLPEVVPGDGEFGGGAGFVLRGLRHPVVETNSPHRFVRNDLEVGTRSARGVIVYGVNSCGKSVLLKAACASVWLAQCGLCVPAEKMRFSPFSTIMAQVPCRDDVAANRSSFVSEMQGLSCMLRACDSRSLIVADELTRGTEHHSSRAVFAATVKILQERDARFVLTTHLRDIDEPMQCLGVDLSRVRQCHLRVDVGKGGEMTFARTLEDGKGERDDYGVLVACSVVCDPAFSAVARLASGALLSVSAPTVRKCSYNPGLVVRRCEMCGSDVSVETHHIVPQRLASDTGFLPDGVHKNARSNLLQLCKKCHVHVHKGRDHPRHFASLLDSCE